MADAAVDGSTVAATGFAWDDPGMSRTVGRPGPVGRRRLLLALTLLAGAGSAFTVAASGAAVERTFAAAHAAAQSTMSVAVPLFGILLAGDLRRSRSRSSAGTYGAALAVAVAVFGMAVSALAVAVLAAGPAETRWGYSGTAALGGLLVQALAALVGVGLGLLLRPPFVAFVASAVVPLGLWWLLGTVAVLRPWQDWLTPYANARHLLSGDMTTLQWAQSVVVLVLWGGGPTVWGLRRLRRQASESAAPAASI
jgi:hypothetical protein